MFTRHKKRPNFLVRHIIFERPSSATMTWWTRRDSMLKHVAPLRYKLNRWLSRSSFKIGAAGKRWRYKLWSKTCGNNNTMRLGLPRGHYSDHTIMLYSVMTGFMAYVEKLVMSKRYGVYYCVMTKTSKRRHKKPIMTVLEALDDMLTNPLDSLNKSYFAEIRDIYHWWVVERPHGETTIFRDESKDCGYDVRYIYRGIEDAMMRRVVALYEHIDPT